MSKSVRSQPPKQKFGVNLQNRIPIKMSKSVRSQPPKHLFGVNLQNRIPIKMSKSVRSQPQKNIQLHNLHRVEIRNITTVRHSASVRSRPPKQHFFKQIKNKKILFLLGIEFRNKTRDNNIKQTCKAVSVQSRHPIQQ